MEIIQYYKKHFWQKYLGKKAGHEPLGLEHFPMWGTKYNTGGRTLFTSYAATIQGLENMRLFDIRNLLPRINVSTLILVGDEDIDAPIRYSKVLNQLIRKSQLIIVPEANHDVAIGKAVTTFQYIDRFLKEKEEK